MQLKSSGSLNLSVDKIYSIIAVKNLRLLFQLRDPLPKFSVRIESILSNNFLSMSLTVLRIDRLFSIKKGKLELKKEKLHHMKLISRCFRSPDVHKKMLQDYLSSVKLLEISCILNFNWKYFSGAVVVSITIFH